jgi:hypothetical protein
VSKLLAGHAECKELAEQHAVLLAAADASRGCAAKDW